MKRLLRRRQGRVVAGVCAGLADYIGLSRNGLRFLVCLGTIATGLFPGLFVYLACLVLIPCEETGFGPGADARGNPWRNPSEYTHGTAHPEDPWHAARDGGYTGSETRDAGYAGSEAHDAGHARREARGAGHVHREASDSGSARFIGILMVLAGVALLLRTFLPWLDWRFIMAGGLVVFGLLLLFRKGE